jgi:hypothetical protein
MRWPPRCRCKARRGTFSEHSVNIQ